MITKFNTNISNAHTWYTDSEGQEMQQRRYNYRPTWQLQVNEPVAGNYYPINTAAYINDTNSDMRFTIVTDRSQGASSLTNGEFEVMLHRRLLHDDSRGVGEPLNETEAIRTVHRVFVGPATNSTLFQREEALRLNNPCLLWFASDFDQGGSSAKEWFSTYASEFIPLRQSLPPNIHLQTLKPLDTPNQFLLRLNHIYAHGEHPKYSQPVQVNIASLFANFDVLKLEEQNLSANQPKSQVHRYSWKTAQSNAVPRHKGDAPPFTVVLSPMEIRTFILSVQPSP
ncbi:Mannosidase alpha class 2B member 1 [Balamuthia mandrillaris]